LISELTSAVLVVELTIHQERLTENKAKFKKCVSPLKK
jgi:hypothetical protein